MAVSSIDARLEAALAERLTELSTLPPVAWPGMQFPAPGDVLPSQFVEFRLARLPRTRQTFDANRVDAVLRLSLKTKLPCSGIAAADVAGNIAAHINALPTFTRQSVDVIVHQPAGVLQDIYEDGWVIHLIEATVLTFS